MRDLSSSAKSTATSPIGILYRNRTLSPLSVPPLLLMCVCSSCVPLRSTHSSTILPTCSFLHTIVASTIGSEIPTGSEPGTRGIPRCIANRSTSSCIGLDTSTLCVSPGYVTLYGTVGAVAMTSAPNSSRSR